MSGISGTENDVNTLREALFGRSVISIRFYDEDDLGEPPRMRENVSWDYGKAEGEVHLDDGTVLLLAGNIGGCSCGAGDYYLSALNDTPLNGITDVQIEVDDSKLDPKYGEGPQAYNVFVLAMGMDEPVKLASFEGDDGNGYYGTGFRFTILPPKELDDA